MKASRFKYPVLIVFAAVLILYGCATERFLTQEQDAEFKEACEEVGCVVVPRPYMMQLLNIPRGQQI